MTETITAACSTYRTRDAAARAWGARHHVAGRSGGFLATTTFSDYDALPQWLKATPAGRRRDPESLAGGRAAVKFLLFGNTFGQGRRCVHGWSSLADILVWHGQMQPVDIDGGIRWTLTEES